MMEVEVALHFPCTMIILGVSGGGKTQWYRKFLLEVESLFACEIDTVILCYGVYQPLYKDMMTEMKNLILNDGCSEAILKQHGVLDSSKKTILILDDLHSELANNPLLSKLFCKFAHHHNTMVIFVTQNLYHKGCAMRDTISNCHYLICLCQPRDKTVVTCLARQMFPDRYKYFLQAYNDATSTPFGYLLVDARPETSNELRLRSGIFKGETACMWLPA